MLLVIISTKINKNKKKLKTLSWCEQKIEFVKSDYFVFVYGFILDMIKLLFKNIFKSLYFHLISAASH